MNVEPKWNIVRVLKGLSGYMWGITQGLKLKGLAQLQLQGGQMLYLHDVLYAPEI